MFKLSSVHRSLVAATLLTFVLVRFFLPNTIQHESSSRRSAAAPGTVYRFYVEANDPTDKMSAVFGNDQNNLGHFCAMMGIYNSSVQRFLERFRHQSAHSRILPRIGG